MTDRELFFRLLVQALWKTGPELDCTPAPEQWQAVYDMACRQTVQGIMYDVIRDLPSEAGVPPRLAASWMVESNRIEEIYNRNVALTAAMQSFFDRNAVRAVQLKGSVVAQMYDTPSHRVMGDIDWWLPGTENWDRALELIRGKGYTVETDSDGDIHFQAYGVIVEHHRKGLKAEGPEGMLLLLNEHILHHVSVSGIGMRQLCDMAMAYRFFYGKYDAIAYMRLLRENGLVRWTRLLDAVLVHYLATPREMVPDRDRIAILPDADEKRLVRLVMDDGNFGLHKARRYSGFLRRTGLLMKYSGGFLLRRWLGLAAGRSRRHGTVR